MIRDRSEHFAERTNLPPVDLATAGVEVGTRQSRDGGTRHALEAVIREEGRYLIHGKGVLRRGEQMVERQLRVGLAAAEVGLQVDHAGRRCGGPAIALEGAEHVETEALERAGEVGALEEEGRIAVLLSALVGDGAAEVDGEERLGDGVLLDVAMGFAGSSPSS